jgi:dienelactone hydrolase
MRGCAVVLSAILTLSFLPARLGAADAATSLTTSIPATSETPQIPAYVARPAGSTPAPGVLVLHGCDGYTKHYALISDWLASHGYVAVAIDSLRPRGKKNSCGDWSGSRNEAKDARATLAWMRSQPYVDGSRLALLGYSMGGIATLDVVDPNQPERPPDGLRAAVAYYPSCRNRVAASVSVPLQILDGDADDWTPAPPCQVLATDAAQIGKPVSITTYPGATHAFNVKAPDRIRYGHHLRYDPAASADAETRTLDFFRKYL